MKQGALIYDKESGLMIFALVWKIITGVCTAVKPLTFSLTANGSPAGLRWAATGI